METVAGLRQTAVGGPARAARAGLRHPLRLPVLALVALAAAACEPVVSNEGVAVRGQQGNVRAGVGPDDAALGYSGERIVAGVGTDHQAAAGVRVDGAPMVVGVGTPEDGGLFGGVGFGF